MVNVAAPNPETRPPETRGRRARPARDIVLSLAALLIPIFVLLGVYRVFFAGDAPIAVDPSDAWASARHSASYQVLEPSGLPRGWTVVSASYQGGTLRIGYVTPDGTGLQLVESDQTADALLPGELCDDARPGNLVPLTGRTWREYPVIKGGGRAMVLVDQGRTVVVEGTATDSQVRVLAASLH